MSKDAVYVPKSTFVKMVAKPNVRQGAVWCGICVRRVEGKLIRRHRAFETKNGIVTITSCLVCKHIISVDVEKKNAH